LHAFLDGVSAGVAGILAITAIEFLIPILNSSLFIMALFALSLAALYILKTKFSVLIVIIVSALVSYLF
jgi:chromate transporter